MSRLIDADRIKPEDFYDRIDTEEMMEVINEQPTAYSVEAVENELEELFNAYLENVLIQREGRHYVNAMHIFEKVIEIVKRGGRNDAL